MADIVVNPMNESHKEYMEYVTNPQADKEYRMPFGYYVKTLSYYVESMATVREYFTERYGAGATEVMCEIYDDTVLDAGGYLLPLQVFEDYIKRMDENYG